MQASTRLALLLAALGVALAVATPSVRVQTLRFEGREHREDFTVAVFHDDSEHGAEGPRPRQMMCGSHFLFPTQPVEGMSSRFIPGGSRIYPIYLAELGLANEPNRLYRIVWESLKHESRGRDGRWYALVLEHVRRSLSSDGLGDEHVTGSPFEDDLDMLETCRLGEASFELRNGVADVVLDPSRASNDDVRALLTHGVLAATTRKHTNTNSTSSRRVNDDNDDDDNAVLFLTMEETNRLHGAGGPLAGLLSKLLKPVSEPMGKAMEGTVKGPLGYWVGEVAKPGLSDDIGLEMLRALPPQITQMLVPALTETIREELSEALTRSLADALSETLNTEFTAALSKQLVAALGKSLPPRILIDTPRKTAERVSYKLGHATGKALTHTIVPSLVHMLGHSPMQDYFCYYCYNKQEYCQYCQYSPQQTYFAQYYAGYYSSYYASYYNQYFRDLEVLDRKQHVQQEKEIIAERDKYEVVLET